MAPEDRYEDMHAECRNEIEHLTKERDESNQRREETVAMCEQLRRERDEARQVARLFWECLLDELQPDFEACRKEYTWLED